ncbi:MAG: iron-sulfur cluster repair protein YtfE (RIC family) [Cognaticolwellia sp.]|jgi:iron-sulfur cluster repair protein YtfE (RIC family)
MAQTLPEQIAHVLETHHEVEWQMLQELNAQISTSTDKRLTAPWRHLHDTLSSHMNKEENVLFPAMRAAFEDEHLFPAGLSLREATLAGEDADTVDHTTAPAPRAAHPPYAKPTEGLLSRAKGMGSRIRGLLHK